MIKSFISSWLAVFTLFFINASAQTYVRDVHSYSDPSKVAVKHIDLDWDVDFERKVLRGSATLTIARTGEAPLFLDTRDLSIERAETSADKKSFTETKFELGAADKILGSPLKVELPAGAKYVRIFYSTSPGASGLQWLTPDQTSGKKTPFMFSQAQAIHSRSFIPLQDSPQVRVTYTAKVRTPNGLLAVMSAEGNSRTTARNGNYSFRMTRAIPPYLIAIAVGDLRFRPMSARTGVYAEPSVVAKAAAEFNDTEKMVVATEKTYGPYRWGRYDILVLPPSFPFGGMENPLLTFATPTVIAGDKSLVALVAHELAHSWSGNLVTNATWRDFWLNEGFTTYIERRIVESVYGLRRKEMEAKLGRAGIEEELAGLEARDQILHVDLDGRDPDDGFTGVPYEKAALFLRFLEEKFGRAKFDPFVRSYFNTYAFRSITTETFKQHLRTNLLNRYPGVVTEAEVEEWIHQPGLPASAPQPKSDAFEKVAAKAAEFSSGRSAASSIVTKGWTTQEWLHFLQKMPGDMGNQKMAELDSAFGFTKSGNSEIAFQWLLMSIRQGYKPADARLEEFLVSIGRRKFVRPLFMELAKTPEGMVRAKAIYSKARAGYHPITQAAVDSILK